MLLELLDDDAEPLCDDEELLREVVELPPLDWAKLLAGATMTAAANATDKACLIMSFISFWVLICISPCLKKSAKLLSPFKNVHFALIHKLMPRLGNYCMVFPDFTPGLQRFSASVSVFFVAAEKNGSACSGRSDNGLP